MLFHSAVDLWSDLCLGHGPFPDPDPDQHHQSSLPGIKKFLDTALFFKLVQIHNFFNLNCLSNYRPRSPSRSASPRSPRQVFKAD